MVIIINNLNSKTFKQRYFEKNGVLLTEIFHHQYFLKTRLLSLRDHEQNNYIFYIAKYCMLTAFLEKYIFKSIKFLMFLPFSVLFSFSASTKKIIKSKALRKQTSNKHENTIHQSNIKKQVRNKFFIFPSNTESQIACPVLFSTFSRFYEILVSNVSPYFYIITHKKCQGQAVQLKLTYNNCFIHPNGLTVCLFS